MPFSILAMVMGDMLAFLASSILLIIRDSLIVLGYSGHLTLFLKTIFYRINFNHIINFCFVRVKLIKYNLYII